MSQQLARSPSSMGYWQIRGDLEFFCDDFAEWLFVVVKASEARVFTGLKVVFRLTRTVVLKATKKYICRCLK